MSEKANHQGEKTEIKSKAVRDSVNLFKNGLYCSEAILKAFHENYDLGLTPEFLKVATAFGAGLGASKCCCGSVTGGTLVLSLVAGRSTPEESETAAFESASTLHDEFKKEFKATCCRVLTKPVEWGTPEHHQFCIQYVERAAEITEEILKIKFNLLQKHV